ncbi:MAG: hypothetical protein CL808_08235 [Citromicrobium sp.]|nr:hypothetical protein [Citromicrobium sp.]
MSWATYGAMIVTLVPIFLMVLPEVAVSGVWILTAIALALALIPIAMGIGFYATIWVRCPECGDRFYSAITPTFPINWPLRNHCISCGHDVDVL